MKRRSSFAASDGLLSSTRTQPLCLPPFVPGTTSPFNASTTNVLPMVTLREKTDTNGHSSLDGACCPTTCDVEAKHFQGVSQVHSRRTKPCRPDAAEPTAPHFQSAAACANSAVAVVIPLPEHVDNVAVVPSAKSELRGTLSVEKAKLNETVLAPQQPARSAHTRTD